MNTLLRIFLFTFIFTTFNREFRLFGFDLRYLAVAMAAFLLIVRLIRLTQGRGVSERRHSAEFSFADLAVFYGIAAVSNLSWLWSDLPLNQEQFSNLVILNLSNVLFAGVLVLYREELRRRDILRHSLIALAIMALSMIWVYAGMELPAFLHDSTVRVSSSGENFINLFGQEVRVAGFAEDANYAALFCAIGFALCFAYFKSWTLVQIAAATVFAFTFVLAFSKTLVIGIIMAVLMLIAREVISKSWKSFSWIASVTIALFGIVIMSRIPILQELATTSTRFALWSIAETVLEDNPILGGGLSSVRSAINVAHNGLWYVQCHSTFWQALAEHGPFAFIAFVVMVSRRYAICRSWWQVFILTQFVALCLTCELMYQQVFVYILVLMPLLFLSSKPATEAQEGQVETRKAARFPARAGVSS